MSDASNGTPALIATIRRALSICTPKPTLSRTAVFGLSVPNTANSGRTLKSVSAFSSLKLRF